MDGRDATHHCKECDECCIHLRPALALTNRQEDVFCDMYHPFFLCLCSERGTDEDDEWAAVTCHVPWDKYSAALIQLLYKRHMEYHLRELGDQLEDRWQSSASDEESREDHQGIVEEFGDLSEVTQILRKGLEDLERDLAAKVEELREIGRRREERMGTDINRKIAERFDRLVTRGGFRERHAQRKRGAAAVGEAVADGGEKLGGSGDLDRTVELTDETEETTLVASGGKMPSIDTLSINDEDCGGKMPYEEALAVDEDGGSKMPCEEALADDKDGGGGKMPYEEAPLIGQIEEHAAEDAGEDAINQEDGDGGQLEENAAEDAIDQAAEDAIDQEAQQLMEARRMRALHAKSMRRGALAQECTAWVPYRFDSGEHAGRMWNQTPADFRNSLFDDEKGYKNYNGLQRALEVAGVLICADDPAQLAGDRDQITKALLSKGYELATAPKCGIEVCYTFNVKKYRGKEWAAVPEQHRLTCLRLKLWRGDSKMKNALVEAGVIPNDEE